MAVRVCLVALFLAFGAAASAQTPSGACSAASIQYPILSDGKLYGCINGAWAQITSITGMTGGVGVEGPQGPAGPQGPQGPAGPAGSSAWADITGKPSTFAPIIGSGSSDAVAGNDARLTDARTPTAHTHTIANVTSLQPALDAKAAAVHVHAISDVTNLTASLAGKSDTSHTHTGLPTILRVAANVANSTVNFADVTGLTMAVTSGQTYRFECNLSFTTAASTTALQLAVNGPSMTAVDYEVVTYTTATAVHAAAQTALDTNTNPATGGGATRLPVRISGSFIPSANGTFAIRSRSEVAASAVTVMRGGWCAVF